MAATVAPTGRVDPIGHARDFLSAVGLTPPSITLTQDRARTVLSRIIERVRDFIARNVREEVLRQLPTSDDVAQRAREEVTRQLTIAPWRDELSSKQREEVRRVILGDYLVFGDQSKLTIADTAVVNNALFNLSSGEIVIEDWAFFGHHVSLITGTHHAESLGAVRQTDVPESGRDIRIKSGAWIASNAVVLGPCTIGENAVVAACSLVNEDVPPNSIFGGVPARFLREIEEVREPGSHMPSDDL